MSNIDKRALREAAEKATPGRVGDRIDGSGSIKYECRGYDDSLVLRTDHKNMEYGFVGDNANADELFFLLCAPDVVLALLDELKLKEEQRANWFQMAQKLGEDLDAAEKHIAELEARTVKLPEPISVLHRRDFNDAHRAIYAYPEAEVNAALAAAGIGKGE